MQRYGPSGRVELCSAKALSVFVVATGVVGAILATAGENAIGGAFIGVTWLIAVSAIFRAASAGRAGRRWRESKHSDSTP